MGEGTGCCRWLDLERHCRRPDVDARCVRLLPRAPGDEQGEGEGTSPLKLAGDAWCRPQSPAGNISIWKRSLHRRPDLEGRCRLPDVDAHWVGDEVGRLPALGFNVDGSGWGRRGRRGGELGDVHLVGKPAADACRHRMDSVGITDRLPGTGGNAEGDGDGEGRERVESEGERDGGGLDRRVAGDGDGEGRREREERGREREEERMGAEGRV